MKKIIFLAIILLAFTVRLYRLNFPIADWHSWRQADTSAVSRNLLKGGFDVLHPRFDDLSNIPSGLENPQGYRFVEFPIYNLFQAGLAKTFPFLSLEIWGRLVSIFCSLVSLTLLFLITRRYLGENTALLAAFFFAVLPYNVFYSRVILPEPMLVMFSLGMIYFFDRPLLFVLFTALALLIKPIALVFLLPAAYLYWQKHQFNWSKWVVWAFSVLLALVPFLAWRRWMAQFPEGIPAFGWLFNDGGIRFKGAWFYWLFGERLAKLILGYWGTSIFVLGLLVTPAKKAPLFFFTWLVAILAYLTIIAAGNVRHDYYQIITIPIICVFLAKGAAFLLTAPKEYFNKIFCYALLVISCSFMLAFSWYQVRDFFNINNGIIVEAGKAVDRLVPKDAKVIAPYGGDTAFLYQTNRQGWPMGIEIEKLIKLGAQYYVNVNFGPETQWVMSLGCVLEKTPNWVVIDLTKNCQSR